MTELCPWWVTSDPDHPVNAAQPVPQAPLMSEAEPQLGSQSAGFGPTDLEPQTADLLHLTRPFSETVAARAAVDPEFAAALAEPEDPIEMPDMTNLPSRDPFPVPTHITAAVAVAESPHVTDEDREAAVRTLLEWQAERGVGGAEHVSTSAPNMTPDAHPSSIPADLITKEAV